MLKFEKSIKLEKRFEFLSSSPHSKSKCRPTWSGAGLGQIVEEKMQREQKVSTIEDKPKIEVDEAYKLAQVSDGGRFGKLLDCRNFFRQGKKAIGCNFVSKKCQFCVSKKDLTTFKVREYRRRC